MANVLLDQLINEGKLPTLDVQVQVDDKSIYRLAGAILIALVISILIQAVILKHTK